MKILFSLLILLSFTASAQTCHPDSLRTYEVRASETDARIAFELRKHFAWHNPSCQPKNLLLLHLVGTIDHPQSTTYFPALAANHGYHALSLKYPNGTSAQSPCRNSIDSSCFERFRREIIEGINYSPDIQVDTVDCINNRLIRLLQYLHAQHPAEGWDTYFSGNAIHWSQLVLSGHSQGGGHAALIAKDHRVNRVIMFASPNDFSEHFNEPAFWASRPSSTPAAAFYAFANLHDDIVDFPEQYQHWTLMGMAAFGDSLRIQGAACPFDHSHRLYTIDSRPGLAVSHSLMIRDDDTPLDSTGKAVYEDVWKYLLGLPCGNVGMQESRWKEKIRLYPNPCRDELFLEGLNQGFGLEIMNLQGIVCQRMSALPPSAKIDLGKLPAGVYVVHMRSKDGAYRGCRRLVKIDF